MYRLAASLLIASLGLSALGLSALGLSSSALAAPGERIGATLRVVNLVTAAYEQENRNLAAGDGVRQQELIGVGSDSLGELEFVDKTKLALGPGAKLLLDKFVYDPDKAGGSIVVNLVKGSFRFITGIAAKPTYVIKTPSAAITVRGTIFDLYVQDSGMTWLLLHEGGIKICNTRGTCRDHSEPGKLIRVTDTGDVGVPVRWTGLPNADGVPFDAAFPFVVAPPSFDPTPIFTRDALLTDEPAQEPRRGQDDGEPRRTKKPGKKDEPRKAETPERDAKPAGKVKETKVKPKDDDDDKGQGKGVRIKPGKTKVTEGKPAKPKGGRVKYTEENIKTGMDIVLGAGSIRIGGGSRPNRGGDYGKYGGKGRGGSE